MHFLLDVRLAARLRDLEPLRHLRPQNAPTWALSARKIRRLNRPQIHARGIDESAGARHAPMDRLGICPPMRVLQARDVEVATRPRK